MPSIHRASVVAAVVAATGAFALTAAATGAPAAAGPARASSGTTQVGTRHTSIGTVLVNGKGRTLYAFSPDSNGKPHCTGSCATYWPPLTTSRHAKATGGAKRAKLGRVKRGGTWQVTYARHPLYTYVGDTSAGQTNGQGVNSFGGNWYALRPSGSPVR